MLPILFVLLVSAHNLHSGTVTKKSTDVIKFPEDNTPLKVIAAKVDQGGLTSKHGGAEVPEECKHLSYCTVKPASYPDEKFKEMFKDYKIPPMPLFDALGNRQGDIDYADDCESEVTYEPLYNVREKGEDSWRVVIQAPEQDFVQRVRLETCKNMDKPCFKPFLPGSRYQTYCHQTYNTWEVLVQKGENDSELIKTELPVCCSCKYKHHAFTTRFSSIDSEENTEEKQKE